MINVDESVENVMYVNVLCCVLFFESTTCCCKNGKYSAYIHLYILDYSANTHDEIIEEETKTISANVNEKKQPVKQEIYIFYLPCH